MAVWTHSYQRGWVAWRSGVPAVLEDNPQNHQIGEGSWKQPPRAKPECKLEGKEGGLLSSEGALRMEALGCSDRLQERHKRTEAVWAKHDLMHLPVLSWQSWHL